MGRYAPKPSAAKGSKLELLLTGTSQEADPSGAETVKVVTKTK